MRPLLVATNNAGKQAEFRRLLAPLGTTILMPADAGIDLIPEEPHDTYAENAAAKADAFCRASGLVTLADDAGIEVAALGGGPGVHTARYADGTGMDGVEHLLDRLARETDRRARMVCWLALAIPFQPGDGGVPPSVELFHGTMDGRVARARRGSGGFGFDPIFELPIGVTTAELAPDEKDRISHRGRAVAAALPRLHEVLGVHAESHAGGG